MKKCVNGNCSRRHECARYHQAANTFEASGSNGKYACHSCRKGKCDFFVEREMSADEMMAEAMGIVNRYGQIVEIVKRFENDEFYNSLAAIEAVAKIIHGEVAHE